LGYSSSDEIYKGGQIPKSMEEEDLAKNIPIESYLLSANYPNPFNPTTNIVYQIKKKGFVSLKVFDIIGREVAQLVNESEEPGQYLVTFDARNLPSGVYIYSLRVNDFVSNQKMSLVK